jgi:hypothetical protein
MKTSTTRAFRVKIVAICTVGIISTRAFNAHLNLIQNIALYFLRLSDNLNSLLSPVMFAHIVTAAIMLSALGFSLTVSKSHPENLPVLDNFSVRRFLRINVS